MFYINDGDKADEAVATVKKCGDRVRIEANSEEEGW
jgi:hypothetical protein